MQLQTSLLIDYAHMLSRIMIIHVTKPYMAVWWQRWQLFLGRKKYCVLCLMWNLTFDWTYTIFTSHGLRITVFHIEDGWAGDTTYRKQFTCLPLTLHAGLNSAHITMHMFAVLSQADVKFYLKIFPFRAHWRQWKSH